MLGALVFDDDAILFDDGVGEHVSGDFVEAGLGFLAGESIEFDFEDLALADIADFGMSEGAEATGDGLPLGVEDGGLEGDVDAGAHRFRLTGG